MCRLLAYAAPSATTFSDVIGDEGCAAFQRLARLHGDGWGRMWVQDPTPGDPSSRRLLRRQHSRAGGVGDAELTNALRQPRSRAAVVHLRMATAGLPVHIRNTHPFVGGGIGLAHNGTIAPVADLRGMLSCAARARLRGSTDSELYFGLVRERVADGLPLTEAVAAAVAAIRERFPVASLNAIVLSAHEIVVVHSSTQAPLPTDAFTRSGLPAAEFPPDHGAEYYRMGLFEAPDGTIAVASSGVDVGVWAPLPLDTLTTIDLASLKRTTWTFETGFRSETSTLVGVKGGAGAPPPR